MKAGETLASDVVYFAFGGPIDHAPQEISPNQVDDAFVAAEFASGLMYGVSDRMIWD